MGLWYRLGRDPFDSSRVVGAERCFRTRLILKKESKRQHAVFYGLVLLLWLGSASEKWFLRELRLNFVPRKISPGGREFGVTVTVTASTVSSVANDKNKSPTVYKGYLLTRKIIQMMTVIVTAFSKQQASQSI